MMVDRLGIFAPRKTLNKLGLLRFARNDSHFLPVIARSEVTKQSIKRGCAGVPWYGAAHQHTGKPFGLLKN
jgi:hypothetical protein